MIRVGKNDLQAFDELVERYRNTINTMLLRHVRNRADAEELSQEVFLRIFLARERYVPRSKFSTWLYMIVRNVGLNAKRSISRRPTIDGQLDAVEFSNRESRTPCEILESEERREVVQRALARLPARQHEALTLNCFKHMSYAQVADEMETSPQSIKSLLYRARDNLRENVEEYFESA